MMMMMMIIKWAKSPKQWWAYQYQYWYIHQREYRYFYSTYLWFVLCVFLSQKYISKSLFYRYWYRNIDPENNDYCINSKNPISPIATSTCCYRHQAQFFVFLGFKRVAAKCCKKEREKKTERKKTSTCIDRKRGVGPGCVWRMLWELFNRLLWQLLSHFLQQWFMPSQ